MRLGERDSDGEVRYLLIRNEDGRIAKFGQLPPSLTYRAATSEMDGSSINSSPDTLMREGYGSFQIYAYRNDPISQFETRLPAVIKSIHEPTD